MHPSFKTTSSLYKTTSKLQPKYCMYQSSPHQPPYCTYTYKWNKYPKRVPLATRYKKNTKKFKKKFSAYWRNRIASPSWARAACSRSSCCWRGAGTPLSRYCRRRTGSGRPGRGWCAACTRARTPLRHQLASALYTHHVAAIQINFNVVSPEVVKKKWSAVAYVRWLYTVRNIFMARF